MPRVRFRRRLLLLLEELVDKQGMYRFHASAAATVSERAALCLNLEGVHQRASCLVVVGVALVAAGYASPRMHIVHGRTWPRHMVRLAAVEEVDSVRQLAEEVCYGGQCLRYVTQTVDHIQVVTWRKDLQQMMAETCCQRIRMSGD